MCDRNNNFSTPQSQDILSRFNALEYFMEDDIP